MLGRADEIVYTMYDMMHATYHMNVYTRYTTQSMLGRAGNIEYNIYHVMYDTCNIMCI